MGEVASVMAAFNLETSVPKTLTMFAGQALGRPVVLYGADMQTYCDLKVCTLWVSAPSHSTARFLGPLTSRKKLVIAGY